jgi:hypothetical protein
MRRMVLACALLAAGCGRGEQAPDDLAALDRELAANTSQPARDPALTASLRDQIMVDPQLTQSSNANAIRPPSRPDTGATPPVDVAALPDTPAPAGLERAPAPSGDCPECDAKATQLTLGALAEARTGDCGARVRYSAAWANRLPAAVPLYPDARVVEAAGTDEGACALRVVSFRSGAPVDRLADFYWTRARGAGFTAEHKAKGALHLVGGTRGTDAYLAYLTARPDGGTDVDLVARGG